MKTEIKLEYDFLDGLSENFINKIRNLFPRHNYEIIIKDIIISDVKVEVEIVMLIDYLLEDDPTELNLYANQIPVSTYDLIKINPVALRSFVEKYLSSETVREDLQEIFDSYEND